LKPEKWNLENEKWREMGYYAPVCCTDNAEPPWEERTRG
jgi:hypothetical protein